MIGFMFDGNFFLKILEEEEEKQQFRCGRLELIEG